MSLVSFFYLPKSKAIDIPHGVAVKIKQHIKYRILLALIKHSVSVNFAHYSKESWQKHMFLVHKCSYMGDHIDFKATQHIKDTQHLHKLPLSLFIVQLLNYGSNKFLAVIKTCQVSYSTLTKILSRISNRFFCLFYFWLIDRNSLFDRRDDENVLGKASIATNIFFPYLATVCKIPTLVIPLQARKASAKCYSQLGEETGKAFVSY